MFLNNENNIHTIVITLGERKSELISGFPVERISQTHFVGDIFIIKSTIASGKLVTNHVDFKIYKV